MRFWEVVVATAMGTALYRLLSGFCKRFKKLAERKGWMPWLKKLFSLKPWRVWPTPIKFVRNNNYIVETWEFSPQRRISLVPHGLAQRLVREGGFQRIGWREWYEDCKIRRAAKRKRKMQRGKEKCKARTVPCT